MCKKRGLATAGFCCCVSMLGWAQYSEAGAGKVSICHKSDSVKYHQITVASRAVPAHLAHGDCVVDDGVPCTVDRCDADLGCIHAPDNSACDDSDACTGDTCDPATGCVHTDIICNDDNPCTDDVCNGGVCEYTPDDTNSCEDGVFCNGTASCVGGSCGVVSACPPIGDPCLVVTCDEDNDECDVTEKCDDGTFCTTDFCDPGTGDCGYIDTCPAAIDLENCLVYGRCDEAGQACPADPLEPCCGNGIVEGGEDCETDADCAEHFFCNGCTCTPEPSPECDGATCETFIPCNPGSGCTLPVCATTDTGGVCLEGATPCANLPDCTTSADCPGDGLCAVGTCCDRNVCVDPSIFCLSGPTAVVPTAPVKTKGRTISQGAN